jgi:hypothetical protein
MDLLREQLQHAAGILALLGVQSKSLEATPAARVLRFHPPSERFLPDAAFHESAGRLGPSCRRFAVSLARFSAKKIGQRLIVWNTQSNSNLALRFEAKNAPDICRAFSVCLRCCLVDFTLPLTGTGFPSVRSFRACSTNVEKGHGMEMGAGTTH